MSTLKKIILLETDSFVVVNKPSGMLTIQDRHDESLPSLCRLLQKELGTIMTVHRLDRETSGILVFARTESFHQHLSMQFEQRKVQKFYVALVNGKLSEKKGNISLPITEHPVIKGRMITAKKGKAASTDYEVLEEFGLYSYLRLQIHTGRTHQIRVHLQSIGHPVAVDGIYGSGQPILLSNLKRKFRLAK
ncbi:MAG: RluA family pseudouridine synthase, partial [Chitinophagaceae bacterium]